MNTKPLLVAAAVVIVLAIGYFAFAGHKASAPTEMATTTDTGVPVTINTTSTTTTVTTTSPKAVTITYGPNGFSPANVSVALGTTVTWVNQSGGRMWVASGVHPTHTLYDGTSVSEHCANNAPKSGNVFDECSAGSSFSFTFTKAGSWEYHNHAQASAQGVITVQ